MLSLPQLFESKGYREYFGPYIFQILYLILILVVVLMANYDL
jgi:hypothetical protein